MKGHIDNLRLKIVLPATIKNRQILKNIEYSTEPDSIYKRFNNAYAMFSFYDIDRDFKITIKEDITIYRAIAAKN